jgi:hypothetical protein
VAASGTGLVNRQYAVSLACKLTLQWYIILGNLST